MEMRDHCFKFHYAFFCLLLTLQYNTHLVTMGDNANRSWEWHNTTVGQGYQAKGVIRQRTGREGELTTSSKILDMSSKASEDRPEKKSKKEHKKESKKDSKKSKKHKHHSSKSDKKRHFNPLLQLLATRLSNKTLQFTEMN